MATTHMEAYEMVSPGDVQSERELTEVPRVKKIPDWDSCHSVGSATRIDPH